MPRPGCSPCINVEQLGGDVPYLLDCSLPGLCPLIAAEAVQGSVLRRGAHVTRYQVQRVNGHVQLVAAGILEAQELSDYAARFKYRQAEISANAVFRVHDRRTHLEIAELPDDGFRIALATPSAAPWLVTEELLLADDCDPGIRQQYTFLYRRYGDRNFLISSSEESAPSLDADNVETTGTQHLENALAPAGRVGAKQDTPIVRLQKLNQSFRGIFVPGLDSNCGRQPRGQVYRCIRFTK